MWRFVLRFNILVSIPKNNSFLESEKKEISNSLEEEQTEIDGMLNCAEIN